VVVTGFEPFDGLPHNPSAAVLAHLPATLGGRALYTAVLPVDSVRVGSALTALPAEAAVVLHLGLATDRPALTLERVGLNLLDFSRPDNAGRTVLDAEVVPGAPLALPVRLPVRSILAAWRAAGIVGTTSTSAGTYLCNQALYLSLHQRAPDVRVGFVHLPPDEVLAASGRLPHQPLAVQVAAVLRLLEVVVADGLPA
jgi:pyroglutamyl-peptidase